jgi:hypothetical protein
METHKKKERKKVNGDENGRGLEEFKNIKRVMGKQKRQECEAQTPSSVC